MPWPIRGQWWYTLTNQRPHGLRFEGRARKGNARKLWSSFFHTYPPLFSADYLLSWEPSMGLELPLSWHLSFSCRDDRLDIWWHKTAGKSTNIFGPITSQHEPQWRLFCPINCVLELLQGLRFISRRSFLHSFVHSVLSDYPPFSGQWLTHWRLVKTVRHRLGPALWRTLSLLSPAPQRGVSVTSSAPWQWERAQRLGLSPRLGQFRSLRNMFFT